MCHYNDARRSRKLLTTFPRTLLHTVRQAVQLLFTATEEHSHSGSERSGNIAAVKEELLGEAKEGIKECMHDAEKMAEA